MAKVTKNNQSFSHQMEGVCETYESLSKEMDIRDAFIASVFRFVRENKL